MISVTSKKDNHPSSPATAAYSPWAQTDHSRHILLQTSTVSRLDTLAEAFPRFNSAVSKSDWARMGFYYDIEFSSVQCISCCVSMPDSWKTSTLEAIRKLHLPHCEFSDYFPSRSRSSHSSEVLDGPSLSTNKTEYNASYAFLDVDLGSRLQLPNPKSKITALKEENRRLKSQMACRRCQTAQVETLYLPCRHLVSCETCAEEEETCIECASKILGTVRVYFS